VAALFLLGLLATAGVKSYRDLKAARDLETDLERRIAESEARIRALTEHVRRVEEDPLTLERLAREELGMVKPGDVVIVLPEDEEPPPDGRPLEDRPPDGRPPDP
jgi:cell division protein FtsB